MDWIATLVGGPYDGERIEIETIWPRIKAPARDGSIVEYHRVAYDADQETADYLIVPNAEGRDPLTNH